MTIMLTDPRLEQRLKLEREESGADRYDEVWEGIYMMTPMPIRKPASFAARLSL